MWRVAHIPLSMLIALSLSRIKSKETLYPLDKNWEREAKLSCKLARLFVLITVEHFLFRIYLDSLLVNIKSKNFPTQLCRKCTSLDLNTHYVIMLLKTARNKIILKFHKDILRIFREEDKKRKNKICEEKKRRWIGVLMCFSK